jgi:hypothetical protein
MKRKRPQTDSSLDLFLDAISNTFGGVMFLAILLTLLVQFQSKAPDVESQSDASLAMVEDPSRTLVQLQKLRLERDELIESIAAFSGTLPSPEDNVLAKKLEELNEIRADATNLVSEQIAAAERITETLGSSNDLRVAMNQLESNLVTESVEAETKRNALRQSVDENSKTVDPPSIEPTDYLSVSLLLRYGKIYPVFKDGQTTPYLKHVQYSELGNDAVSVQPKQSAGWDLNSTEDEQEFQNYMRQHSRRLYFAYFIVWPDSFEAYAKVREWIVENDYTSNIVPIENMPSATFGNTTVRATAQ